MNKLNIAVAIVVALVNLSVIADSGSSFSPKKIAHRLNLGGRIVKPNSVKGRIVFYDTQTRFPANQIAGVIRQLTKQDHYPIDLIKGDEKQNPADVLKDSSANLLIKIVDLPNLPVLCVAPEDRWCVLNVHPLNNGLADNAAAKTIFYSRCRKELVRAFVFVAGGVSSQYSNNLTIVSGIKDLDATAEELPVDMRDRFKRYLGGIGVSPAQMVPYYFACQQGWAPAPTNDVQKAIWDKVHAMPTAPLTIKPETKKVKD